MNLRALRLFRQIVLTGSLAEASRRLNVSTSAASRLLSILEGELDLQLFSREKRRLVLTESGDLLYSRLLRTLDGLDELPGLAREIKAREHDRLSIVVAAPLAATFVSPALALLAGRRAGFRASLNVETRFDIESKVAARAYGLGLISLPVENAILDLEIEPFLRARVEVLAHGEHPLAARQAIAAADLEGAGFVALQPRQRWRERLDAIMGEAGLVPRIAFETTTTMLTLQMVRDGLGLGLVDRATLQLRPHDEAVMRPLEPPRWITYAAIHAQGPRAPLACAFLDAVSEVVEARRAADPAAAAMLELI
jgi:DNA-binding transcriptional LysR family regulator